MQLFGLLGFPLGHSFSKTYFTEKFKTEKIDAEFVNFESDNIEQTLQVIKTTPSLKGFAVTIPYKEKIIPYLDHISEDARKIGAVNSVKVEHTISGSIQYRHFRFQRIFIRIYPNATYTSLTFRHWRSVQSRPACTCLFGNRSIHG